MSMTVVVVVTLGDPFTVEKGPFLHLHVRRLLFRFLREVRGQPELEDHDRHAIKIHH